MSLNMHTRSHARQRGVSIVEALVALVVLSVGLLGVAGLYLTSVKANKTALTRSSAVELVNSMADRIRANRRGEANYATARAPLPATIAAPTDDCNAVAVHCTPVQLAAYDINRWQLSVSDSMPNGPDNSRPEVEIRYVGGATWRDPDRYVVLVAWKEPGDANFLTSEVEVLQLGEKT
jgi:type IV pilus assembly protein PilV